MIIQHKHQVAVMRHIFGDQADDVPAWANEHLTPAPRAFSETTPREGDDTSPWISSDEIWERCKVDPPEVRSRMLNEWTANGREAPVRVFMQVGEDPLNQVATITVTDRENHNRQVAEVLRALADEIDKPGT